MSAEKKKGSPVFLRRVQSPGAFVPLNGAILAFLLFLNSCFHAYLISSPDSMRELLRLFGVGADRSLEEQNIFLTRLLSWSFGVNLVGAFPIGCLADVIGPKLVGCLAMSCNFASFALFAFTSSSLCHWAGATIIGFTFTSCLNSHLGVSVLFPGFESTVVGLIGGACNMSGFMPLILRHLATRTTPQTAAIFFMSGAVVSFVLLFFIMPSKPLSIEDAVKEGEEEPQEETKRLLEVTVSEHKTNEKEEEISTCLFEHLPVQKQIVLPVFLLFTIFFSFTMFRRNYYALTARSAFTQIAEKFELENPQESAAYYAEAFNIFQPFSFVGSIILGFLTDIIGMWIIVFFLNMNISLFFFLTAFCSLPYQWGSIFAFTLLDSYLFMHMCAFVQGYFGFKTFGKLQGVLSVGAAVGVFSFEPFMMVVNSVFKRDLLLASRWLAIISVVAFVLPGFLWFRMNRYEKEKKKGRQRVRGTTMLACGRNSVLPVQQQQMLLQKGG